MRRGTYAALMLLLLALGGAVYSLQAGIDKAKGENAAAEEFLNLPRAEYLKTASLGNQQLLADLLWLKAVQNIGEKKISSKGYDWIYSALDTVTTLDPKYEVPYEAGGLILTVLADKVELSNKLLEKGVKYNPEVWQLPFYLGFNYFFFVKDFKSAARYMEMASKVPGSPPYLPLLASRLYVQSEDPAYALRFLLGMYENTKDENVRAKMLQRINLLRSEVTARDLQNAAELYRKKTGRAPADLGDLVHEGLIGSIPEEPNGGYYYIAPGGTVKSSKVQENIGIYIRR